MTTSPPTNASVTPADTRPAFWPIWQFAGLAFAIGFFLISFNHMLQYLGVPENETMQGMAGLLIFFSLCLAGYSLWSTRVLAVHYRKPVRIIWLSELSRTVFFVGLLQMLSVISLPAYVAARAVAAKADAQYTAQQPWTTHTSADGSHSVEAPADWEVYPNPELGAYGIQLTQPQLGIHFMTSFIPKRDLAVKTLEEIIQLSIQSHEQISKTMDVTPARSVQIGGRRCQQTMLTKTFDRTNLTCCMLHWEEKEAWCEVQYWTMASRFDENLPLFEKMVATVHVNR